LVAVDAPERQSKLAREEQGPQGPAGRQPRVAWPFRRGAELRHSERYSCASLSHSAGRGSAREQQGRRVPCGGPMWRGKRRAPQRKEAGGQWRAKAEAQIEFNRSRRCITVCAASVYSRPMSSPNSSSSSNLIDSISDSSCVRDSVGDDWIWKQLPFAGCSWPDRQTLDVTRHRGADWVLYVDERVRLLDPTDSCSSSHASLTSLPTV
jgi:hypothetical protein